MSKLLDITPIFVETINAEIEEGILYISEKYGVAIHLCACGCKGKTVTPLKPIAKITGWTLTKNQDKVTLNPSIGNFSGEAPNYHAHYFIVNNKINWC